MKNSKMEKKKQEEQEEEQKKKKIKSIIDLSCQETTVLFYEIGFLFNNCKH